ncbi:MAG: arginine N-succinyltransferase [Nitrospirota bacterium]|jgi:hypothetical protein
MNQETRTPATNGNDRRLGCLPVLGLLIAAVVVTAIVTVWVVRHYLFPSEFRPVTLSVKEEQTLDAKLERLDSLQRGRPGQPAQTPPGPPEEPALEPEPYSEAGASRSIMFTERELNALLAKNTDLARKVAIDLADDLVSAKLLVSMDEDFPVLGGQVLKVRAGMELAYRDGRPVVVLKGITLMGVPMPNAWLGGMKNIDLVREFGGQPGFWKSFADGVDRIRVSEGRLEIELKE